MGKLIPNLSLSKKRQNAFRVEITAELLSFYHQVFMSPLTWTRWPFSIVCIVSFSGTMTECSVEWIQSSQFISLTTALNDTVVELDRNGRCASRDAIVKYLKNVYHNVRIPSEDIIHRCLGKLIEQRKIYHDGVGYRALIDDSPIHKTEQKRKPCEESEEVSAKLSVKSSIKTRSENGSACPSSKVSKELEIKPNRKKHLSLDGSSKDETTTNCAYSDEDRNRLNLTFLENFINYGTPTMKSKTTKEKKKKTTLLSTQRKSTRYEKVDDEIKIIDISVFDSNLGMRNKKEAVTKSTGIESGDLFHNPGRPYDKHNREGKPIKRPKPHRSRSFTEPSKQRIRNRQSKEVGNDIDFPLRRVMGTEELRNLNRGDLGNAKNRIENEILDKDKKEEVDKARKDKRGSENCIKDTKWRDMSAKLIPKETNLFEKVGCAKYDLEKNGDLTSLSKMTRKSLKVSTDSDTVSGTCQSDALSSFQNGKKKDSSETISDNDNFDENALKCLCLTGILGNETINVAEERMNEMGKRKIKENFEDDSILYYNDSKSEECDCSFEDNHTGVKNIDFDSLDFGYAV